MLWIVTENHENSWILDSNFTMAQKVKNMVELLRLIMQYVNSHLSTTAFVLAGKVKNYISETNFPDYLPQMSHQLKCNRKGLPRRLNR